MIRRNQNAIASVLASVAVFGAVQAHTNAAHGEQPQASGHRVAQNDVGPTPATFVHQPAAAGAALSLFVQGPAGNKTHLVYAPGDGWRSLDGAVSDGGTRKVAATVTPEPDDTVSHEDPLSVFVDGPTGFVFVWTRDGEAWKFIGSVSEPRP